MSNLYVSDLDGTLLRSNEVTSKYTNQVINSLVEEGMIFSYATARSLVTAKKVTEGINAKIPLIVYNGAFVIDNVEKFSFVRKMCTEGMNMFLESRKGDVRTNEVNSLSELKEGNIFYITCIDEPKKLMPLYDKYKDKYHCVYQTDIDTNEQWLEIMPLEASKSNAIKQLQSMLNCEKLIVFGDGKNDIDMFQMADKSYAVANAHNDLKQFATEVILSNDEDGVARWLEANYKQ